MPQHCCCGALQVCTRPLPVNILLYMHYNEFRKASNTLKILSRTLPLDCCHTFLYGYSEHDQRLEQVLQASSHAFVLFPSEEAVGAEQVRALIAAAAEGKEEPREEEEQQEGGEEGEGQERERRKKKKREGLRNGVSLVVLDGTWREARRMRHSPVLAQVPEIQLAPSSVAHHESLFIARQKSDVVERISTLEAVALLFQELAGTPTVEEGRVDTLSPLREAAHLLLRNLTCTMDHLLLQAGMKAKSNYKRSRPSPSPVASPSSPSESATHP